MTVPWVITSWLSYLYKTDSLLIELTNSPTLPLPWSYSFYSISSSHSPTILLRCSAVSWIALFVVVSYDFTLLKYYCSWALKLRLAYCTSLASEACMLCRTDLLDGYFCWKQRNQLRFLISVSLILPRIVWP